MSRILDAWETLNEEIEAAAINGRHYTLILIPHQPSDPVLATVDGDSLPKGTNLLQALATAMKGRPA